MLKVLVKVTQDHINKGKPKSNCDCAIALAIRSMLPTVVVPYGLSRVGVYYRWARVFSSRGWVYPDLPREAQDFIIKFDSGQSVSPFEFELEIPV